eukprot:1393073-Alexandrium_andersonii.AAC.1
MQLLVLVTTVRQSRPKKERSPCVSQGVRWHLEQDACTRGSRNAPGSHKDQPPSIRDLEWPNIQQATSSTAPG